MSVVIIPRCTPEPQTGVVAPVVIIGVSRPDQLLANLAVADLASSGEEVAELDALDPPAPIYPDGRWPTGGE
jgi:aryl-alcohol dehydrogenase-like predicted oxidoreductase